MKIRKLSLRIFISIIRHFPLYRNQKLLFHMLQKLLLSFKKLFNTVPWISTSLIILSFQIKVFWTPLCHILERRNCFKKSVTDFLPRVFFWKHLKSKFIQRGVVSFHPWLYYLFPLSIELLLITLSCYYWVLVWIRCGIVWVSFI